MIPDLASLMPIALQAIDMGEAHVRSHQPRTWLHIARRPPGL